jgi:signal transduction histidine kinase
VDQHDPLVSLLQEEKDLILLEELQTELEEKRPDDWSKKAAWVYSWMRKLEARLIVPNFSGNRLLAFLVLGPKRSGGQYTTDDIAVFSALANQAALAIENALFFEELRLNESYMIQSEKLASLGQLASGMAHEIHNPLTIISGEAQLYLEQFKGKDGQVDQVLRSIIEECQRAADITRRILRFAKPAPSDLVPVSLKAIVEETLTLAAYQVRLDRIERIVQVPEGLPRVKGNQNQLQEVFLNLVLNACQAMGDKGGKIMFTGSVQEGEVVVKVTDNGPGIPTAALRKVFDPFYTTKANGTGLGLFVCQRIIKSHGGLLTVNSTEGQGTCFIVTLPAAREEPAQELAKVR